MGGPPAHSSGESGLPDPEPSPAQQIQASPRPRLCRRDSNISNASFYSEVEMAQNEVGNPLH